MIQMAYKSIENKQTFFLKEAKVTGRIFLNLSTNNLILLRRLPEAGRRLLIWTVEDLIRITLQSPQGKFDENLIGHNRN